MSSVRKYAISLPADVADALEELREARGQTRSEVIREALEAVIRAEREREAVMQYVRAYEAMPETNEETILGGVGWAEIAEEYPWDEQG